jgi:L-lactate dehydrogenase
MRLVSLISDRVKVDPRSVFGYVIGEHGSTSSIPWSLCTICGMDVETFCRLNCVERFDKESIRKRVLAAGHSIFSKKGYTNYGIGAGISRIIRAIAVDENAVLPVGTLLEGEYGIDGVVMSLPCVIGRNGVERIVRCDFSAAEIDKLNQSASHIRELVSLVASRQLQPR